MVGVLFTVIGREVPVLRFLLTVTFLVTVIGKVVATV